MAKPTPEQVIEAREKLLANARREAKTDGYNGWNRPSNLGKKS